MFRDSLSEQQTNIELAKTVEKYPWLYNYNLAAYSRKDLCDQAWADVGKNFNLSGSACREKWRNLRAVFVRSYKSQRVLNGKQRPYYMAEAMQFLLPYIRHINDKSDKSKETQLDTTDVNSQDSDKDPVQLEIETKVESLTDEDDCIKLETLSEYDDEIFEEEEPTRKRRHENLEDDSHNTSQVETMPFYVTTQDDAVKAFLNSLLPELTEMTSAQFKGFKRKVLMLIDDITEDMT